MHICFQYSPIGTTYLAHHLDSVAGQKYELSTYRRDSTGPVYPHVWEQSDPKHFAFFAGRIAGVAIGDRFPEGHAVSNRDTSSWKMDPEPDGSWLAVKFDRDRDVVSFASDFCLLQRWYYTKQEDSWFVSNSLLFLKELLADSLEVNQQAIPYMLIRGYLPLDQTPISNVHGLRSGKTITIERGVSRIERRLDPVYFYKKSHDSVQAGTPQAVHGVLKNAVASEIAHLDSVCIPLSGGFDSRFLLGCALELLPKDKITTLTFGHPNSLDFRIGLGLAKKLGVRSVVLPFDERPVSELLHDNFRTSEGAYWSLPNHPLQSLRESLKDHPFILSGYIGDLVFGSYEFTVDELRLLETSDEFLLQKIHGLTDIIQPDIVRELLALKDCDPLKTDQACLNIQADSRENQFAKWLWEEYLFNRTNFAVGLHRDLTFYQTPFVHQEVLKLAYHLPKSSRLNQQVYLKALQNAYPDLYNYPTKANAGCSPQERSTLRPHIARATRGLLSKLDKFIGSRTGRIYYHHPRNNYEHPRELMQERHRKDVIAALERVRDLDAFRSTAITDLIDRYMKRENISQQLLVGILTIDLWYTHFHR